jgi:phosphoglycolate phosphatase
MKWLDRPLTTVAVAVARASGVMAAPGGGEGRDPRPTLALVTAAPPTPRALPARPAAVLFDLDGTLCDSEEGIVTHLAMALEATGLPVPGRDRLRTCVGPRWEDGLPHIGVPAERMVEVIAAYRRTYDDAAPGLAIAFPGVPEALARLAGAGLALGVATSKPQHLATRIVTEGPLGRWFAAVVGADPDLGLRTKADVVGAALAELGPAASPATAAMVGDRHFDVTGAAVHGVATVGVGWGCAEPGELEGAGAAAVVATPAELADLLLGT